MRLLSVVGVMDAVQAKRQQVRKAGHLNSKEQENVSTQGNTITIEPAVPDMVYISAYDPWLVYDYPVVAYPAEYRSSGVMTFIVNKSGAIPDKDLGPSTTKLKVAYRGLLTMNGRA
jgi:hypothetical protein